MHLPLLIQRLSAQKGELPPLLARPVQNCRTVFRPKQFPELCPGLFAGSSALLAQLQNKLDGGCLDFSAGLEPILEDLASLDEELMNRYLEGGSVTSGDAASLVARRLVFPCFFGSALKLEGVEALLDGLSR